MNGKTPAIEAFYLRCSTCERCPSLVRSRRQVVNGHGPAPCPLMLIGEAPGMHGADKTGIPFTGDRSGDELHAVLADLGIPFDAVYITNAVRCCPAKNRRPSRADINRCRTLLSEELALVQPKVVVMLGHSAVRACFSDWRGSVVASSGGMRMSNGIAYIIAPHPAWVCRTSPANRKYLTYALEKAINYIGGPECLEMTQRK